MRNFVLLKIRYEKQFAQQQQIFLFQLMLSNNLISLVRVPTLQNKLKLLLIFENFGKVCKNCCTMVHYVICDNVYWNRMNHT